MIERKVLKKGQVVIPKSIRELLGIHEGDKIFIDLEDDNVVIRKEEKVSVVLGKIADKHHIKIDMDGIKKDLSERFGG